MTNLIAIACGGAVGAIFRYLVSGLGYKLLGEDFPWGTLTVNLFGCFAVGFLWVTFEKYIVPPQMRSFVLIGGLGAFTTFSTFGLESVQLLQTGQVKSALLNIFASNLLGLAFVFAGFVIAGRIYDIMR